MAKITKIIGVMLFIFFVSSCTKNDNVKLNFLSGYIAWKQNDWNKASSKFFTCIDLTQGTKDEEIKMYADFAIGSVYLMQNEDVSALSRFDGIRLGSDKQLDSNIYYQKGIIAFKNQDYLNAVMLFKKSLELEPDSIDAKINFELSMRYLKKQKDKPQSTENSGVSEHEEDDPSDRAILNLIRKKEKEQWRNKNQENKISPAFDY